MLTRPSLGQQVYTYICVCVCVCVCVGGGGGECALACLCMAYVVLPDMDSAVQNIISEI